MIIPQRNLIILIITGILINIILIFFQEFTFIAGLYYLIIFIICILDFFNVPLKKNIELIRTHSKFLSIGAFNKIEININNLSNKTLNIELRDGFPEDFIIKDNDTILFNIAPFSAAACIYHIKPVKKGDYEFQYINLRVKGFLGFISRQYKYKINTGIKVYPNLKELSRYLKFLANSKLEQIGYKGLKKGGRDEFDFLRNYEYGDNYRQINWKATAKRHNLITQINRKDYHRNIVVLIDSGKMMTTKYDILTKLDYSIDASLILASSCKSNKDLFGLLVFNKEIISYIPPSSHTKVYDKILGMLYNITPAFHKTDYLRTYSFLRNKLNKNSIIFVFSELYNKIVSEDLIKLLILLSKHHTVRLVSFEEQDEYVDGKNFREITRWIIQQEMILEKELIIRDLNKYGVKTIRVNAKNITQSVVNSYFSTF